MLHGPGVCDVDLRERVVWVDAVPCCTECSLWSLHEAVLFEMIRGSWENPALSQSLRNVDLVQ